MTGHVFISHCSEDDPFVDELRRALAERDVTVWVDSHNLRGGDKLKPEIEAAIQEAEAVVSVHSLNTVNSGWVLDEIRYALEVEAGRDDGFVVIPLMREGIEPPALRLWFGEEPVGIPAYSGVAEALPRLLAALGRRAPGGEETLAEVEPPPMAELRLELKDPEPREAGEGVIRAAATAQLHLHSPDGTSRESRRFNFTAPIGPIEVEELCWYLERYYLWPTGVFRRRAEAVEADLPRWGEAILQAVGGGESARDVLEQWRRLNGTARRFTVEVEADPPEGADEAVVARANEAAGTLLALPWELLHDGDGYLFQGAEPARVCRRLPNRHERALTAVAPPIRVLLVSPRPEDGRAGYIDHRVSAQPLADALDTLGELVELTLLTPPTFAALGQALKDARKRGEPHHVVHFDGHGVFSREHGLGALVFEAVGEEAKLEKRATEIVAADQLGAVLSGHNVPLVFLEACQSAKAEADPTASVAARLLDRGVAAVAAMSHSVLVESARRFVTAFYGALAEGEPVGEAMTAGQLALFSDPHRGHIPGAGELTLQDWFVPVLYLHGADPQLFRRVPDEAGRRERKGAWRGRLGGLPEAPPHGFVGRSRELLALERLLERSDYAQLRGQGGEGKTTLACELARWLVQTRRFRRAAFVSMESHGDARRALDVVGSRLIPNFSVAEHADPESAFQLVGRALRESSTLLVIDNLESVLPPPSRDESAPSAEAGLGYDAEVLEGLLALFRRLRAAGAKLLFTSREALPEPFNGALVKLGRLERNDAVRLVARVFEEKGLSLPANAAEAEDEQLTALVDAVQGHARALVLLAGEVAERGLGAATADLAALMTELHARYPDDRERSLFASVELSLRRLSPESRRQARALALFHGGAHLGVLAHVLEIAPEEVERLADELAARGLAEPMGYGHLRFDPALAPYLAGEVAGEEGMVGRWLAGMVELNRFLYEQLFQNAQMAFALTQWELPNLLAALERMAELGEGHSLVEFATSLEQSLAQLGRREALERVVRLRQGAASALEWGNTRFEAERAALERRLERGVSAEVLTAARALLTSADGAGEGAYPGAAYDIAMAHALLGRVLGMGGDPAGALEPLEEARRRFFALSESGDEDAAAMASAALVEWADCLTALGRLEAAAEAYGEAIESARADGRERSVAVGEFQLGGVRLLQREYAEALAAFEAARERFADLGEPASVATVWHQIGMVQQEAGDPEAAESAYRRALAMEVQQGDRCGEADTLNQLGSLYDGEGRREEAIALFRQAAKGYREVGDRAREGAARNNLAVSLSGLGRLEEARSEIEAAIHRKEPFGHAAEPWKSWAILHNLEQAAGRPEAAAEARGRAVATFRAYRGDGGENHDFGDRRCTATLEALRKGEEEGLGRQMADYLAGEAGERAKALLPKLQAILQGARAPALADDPELFFIDAVELERLLEQLAEEGL